MAALWSFGSTQIFVDKDDPKRGAIKAALKVLDSQNESIQHFGGTSLRHSISGIVIGDANLTQLQSDATAGTSRTFTSDQGSQGTFVIEGDVEAERILMAGAVFDGVTYGVTTPFYRVNMTLVSTA